MVPPYSLRIPRVRRYSGYKPLTSLFAYETITLFGWASHPTRLRSAMLMSVRTPKILLPQVWPLPRSLAATYGIAFCFLFLRLLRCFSSAGSPRKAMYSLYVLWLFTIVVSQFGNLRVEAYLQLTAAYRSLSRPSSAPDAKAFALCSL